MRFALLASLLIIALTGCSKRQPLVAAPPPPPPPVQQPSVTAPRRAPAPAPPAIDRSRAEQPAPLPPAVTPPRLEPLATPAERTAQLRELESIIRRAEDNAAALNGRKGTAQPEEIARVVSLIRQARAAQAASDLPSARSFAIRAEVLSTDLLRR